MKGNDDMTHDPLCPPWFICACDLIAKVRTDERERIAAGIESLAVYLVDDQSEPGGPSIMHRTVSLESVLDIALGSQSLTRTVVTL